MTFSANVSQWVQWGGFVDWATVGVTVTLLVSAVALQRACLWCRLTKMRRRIRPSPPPRWATKTRATSSHWTAGVGATAGIGACSNQLSTPPFTSEPLFGGPTGASGNANASGSGTTGFTPGGVSWT